MDCIRKGCVQMTITIEEAYKFKKDIQMLEKGIEQKMERCGIIEDQAVLKSMKEDYQRHLNDLIYDGITSEGSLVIVDKGRKTRHVNVDRLRQRKDEYECLEEFLTIPLKKVEEFFKGYPDKKDILEQICDVTETHTYDVIDVIEGE